jgi:hypothetical protein
MVTLFRNGVTPLGTTAAGAHRVVDARRRAVRENAQSALSSSVTSLTDFFASPNSIEVLSS